MRGLNFAPRARNGSIMGLIRAQFRAAPLITAPTEREIAGAELSFEASLILCRGEKFLGALQPISRNRTEYAAVSPVARVRRYRILKF